MNQQKFLFALFLFLCAVTLARGAHAGTYPLNVVACSSSYPNPHCTTTPESIPQFVADCASNNSGWASHGGTYIKVATGGTGVNAYHQYLCWSGDNLYGIMFTGSVMDNAPQCPTGATFDLASGLCITQPKKKYTCPLSSSVSVCTSDGICSGSPYGYFDTPQAACASCSDDNYYANAKMTASFVTGNVCKTQLVFSDGRATTPKYLQINNAVPCASGDADCQNINTAAASAAAAAQTLSNSNQAASAAAAAGAAASAAAAANGANTGAAASAAQAAAANAAAQQQYKTNDVMDFCASNPNAEMCKSVNFAHSSSAPDVSQSWYVKQYPNGLSQLVKDKIAAAKATPLGSLASSYAITINAQASTGCWSLPLSMGTKLGNFGNGVVCIPSAVMSALSFFMLITTAFLCRRIIFGG